MANVFSSPEDVINDALVRAGWKKRIGSILEGSDAAKAALDIYGQTRDALLRKFEWGFAERNSALSLQKIAPVGGYNPPLVWSSAYPPLPWIYQYGYPADCLEIRSLRTTDIFIPNFNPQAVNYRIANDNSVTPSNKIVLCNIANAICVYTAQVTDPLIWDASFTEALVADLAVKIAPVLANVQTAQAEAPQAAMDTQSAEMRLG